MRLTRLTGAGLAAFISLAGAAHAQNMSTVPYTCDDGRSLVVNFEGESAEVTMRMSLDQQRAGSGFLYEGAPGALSGQGDEIMWEKAGTGPVTCLAVPGGAALVGGTWTLTRVDDIEAETPERHTIAFLGDGTTLLRADCNQGRGTWAATPETGAMGALALGPVVLTRKACAADPFPRMAADLSDVTAYQVENGTLRLDTRGGRVYIFRASAER